MLWRKVVGAGLRPAPTGAARVLGLGAVTGLRSMAGPALLGRAAAKGLIPLNGTALAFLGSPRVSKALLVMAFGELVGDKLPMTPSRTTIPPLIGRAISGAFVGAALFASEGRHVATGAAYGSSAAVTAAVAGERLRALVGGQTGLPDPVVALAEDAVVLLGGSRLLRGIR